MPRDRKRLLGYFETFQLILGVTDKADYITYVHPNDSNNFIFKAKKQFNQRGRTEQTTLHELDQTHIPYAIGATNKQPNDRSPKSQDYCLETPYFIMLHSSILPPS